MTHTLQFVDKISGSATVRLDLNSAPWSFLVEGHDFSPPLLRRSIAQTMMRAGGTVAAAAYDLRVLKFRLALQAASADAAATAVQNLARELDRSDSMELGGTSNYLKWQPGTSSPVFFRTYRSDMGSIREIGSNDGVRFFELGILAEPFAYGLQEDAGTVTVNNDPAAVSNGMFFDLTGIKGDVDTPLIFEVDDTGLADDTWRPVSVFASRRRGTPANMPVVLQAESMSLANDTSTQANSASFSGSSNNYIRTTFATVTSMANRALVTDFPAADGVDLRGQYRVFVRYRQNSAADGDIKMRLLWGARGPVFTNPTVTAGVGTNLKLSDLGIVTFPAATDPIRDGGTEISVRRQYFELQAQRVAGSGTLDVDYLLFVPADDQMCVLSWPSSPSDLLPDEWVVHGPTETVYAQDSNGRLSTVSNPVGVRGGFLSGRPGVTNRIFFVRRFDAGLDSVTATTSIKTLYYPQYLYVRPATT